MNKRRILAADHHCVSTAQETSFGKHSSLSLDVSVLLVEDMVVNQKVVRIILESLGCKVTIAENGDAACRMFQESSIHAFGIFKPTQFDIILMDLEMPVMDGYSAVSYLKSNFRNMPPIIALTGSIPYLSFKDYQSKGFDDYLFKPILPDELAEKIKFWTKEHKSKTNINNRDFDYLLADLENQPVVNHYVVKNLINYAQNNNSSFIELYDSFVTDIDDLIAKCQNAISGNNDEQLKTLFLNIRGMAGNFGATMLAKVVKYAELSFESNSNLDKTYILSKISEKYHQYKDEIRMEYSNLF